MTRRRRIPRWASARRLVALGFAVALILGRHDWFPWVKGSTTATTVFEAVPFADPLAALEVTLASRDLQATLLVGAALLVALSILAGPVFCGWLCPLGLLLDLNSAIGRRLRALVGREKSPSLPQRGLPADARYLTLGLATGFAAVGELPAFQALSPINALAWSLVFLASPFLLLVLAIAAVEHFLPRLWCRSLCPLGLVYSLAGTYGLLRVRVDPRKECKRPCRECTVRCPMGIRVMEEYLLARKRAVDDPRCTRCGDCIDSCPGGVLHLGFGPRKAPE